MSIALNQILSLVGNLDDSAGENTPRERFRRFLQENITEVGQIRDYVQECLRETGTQYNRALQDLVNYIAHFLGFEVTFGRYQGIKGEIGFDGHWISPQNFHIVVEIKTTDVYAIKTATLMNYINELISEKKIPNWDKALGIYIVGRPDPQLKQLENSIIAENQTQKLRIISVESLLSLAEMMNEYDINHDDILDVLRPSGPTIDSIVDLMARIVAEPEKKEIGEIISVSKIADKRETCYWLTPVKSDEIQTAEEIINTLVGQGKIYAFGERTPGRRHIQADDWICFYAAANGILAHVKIASKPINKPHKLIHNPELYPWTFQLVEVHLYLNNPVVIDAQIRNKLDSFKDRDLEKSWAWFVQATRKITQHDFEILTRRKK